MYLHVLSMTFTRAADDPQIAYQRLIGEKDVRDQCRMNRTASIRERGAY